MADLSDVPTDELVKEMRRRLECQNKPEKRVVLIGAFTYCSHLILPINNSWSTVTALLKERKGMQTQTGALLDRYRRGFGPYSCFSSGS